MENNTGCINNNGLLQMKYKNANQHSLVQVQGAKTLPYSFHTMYLHGMYSRLSLLISLVKYSNSSLSLYWCSTLCHGLGCFFCIQDTHTLLLYVIFIVLEKKTIIYQYVLNRSIKPPKPSIRKEVFHIVNICRSVNCSHHFQLLHGL